MKALFYLNKYFYRYRWRMVAGILFVTISNLFGIIPAKLIRYALDGVNGQIGWYRLAGDFTMRSELLPVISFNLFIFVVLVFIMALLKGLFMFFMRQTIIVVSRYIEYDLKNEIFNHYQQLDMTFYNTNNTGDLMNRISEDVSRVRMYIGPAIMYTVNMVVMFLLITWAMLEVNAELTFYTLLPLPILTWIIYYVHDIINKKSEKVQEQLSGLSTFVQESFSGIRVLKSYVREPYSGEEFKRQSEKYKSMSMDLVGVNALFFPALVILMGLSTIITVYVGGLNVMDGSITVGNVAEFIIYVNLLTWPVASLGWVVSLVQRAAASQQRINEFLHTTPSIVSGSKEPVAVKGEVEFRNVSYSFPNSTSPALENISFKVEAGKSLAITGRTGSGKSTIANLLLRFMDPQEGSVLIDGINIKELNLESYRSQTGFVPQEVFLFSDTIANNIVFGLPGQLPPEERNQLIKEAASDAAILSNIEEFPNGFETMVGERGITLSGGQKQRVSIARAIIRKPSILVFDDCLSAVDTRTEEEILSNLKRIMKNRTTIIISHRVSSIQHADHIVVLDEGRIVAQGNHSGLLKTSSVYAEFYEKQSLEDEVI